MKKPLFKISSIAIIICIFGTILFELWSFPIFLDEKKNFYFFKILSLGFGFLTTLFLLHRENSKLFQRPTKILFLIPAFLIAIDNFQWAAFFSGKMKLGDVDFWDVTLFLFYCLFTGLFEESIFRGIVFPLLAVRFEKTVKGLWKTVVASSLIFGGMHIFNVFSSGGYAILQAGYSVLTGGLFAFVLIKTKNILLCALTHGIYNFCGMLYSSDVGIGMGAVIDLPTALTMLVVCLILGSFVLYSMYRYTEEERMELYKRLGFGLEE